MALPTITERLYRELLSGPEAAIDITVADIDANRVPELLALVDERIAGLRYLRHRLSEVAADPVDTVLCGRCGEAFLPRGRGQRFCSNACRQAAHRNGRRA